MSDTWDKILKLIRSGDIKISEHGYDELAAYGISVMEIITGSSDSVVLEDYPPSQRAANSSWRMNAERVSAEAVLTMRRIAAFIVNMISAGGCASAGFAEAGALVPPTSVGGAPLLSKLCPNKCKYNSSQSLLNYQLI